MAKPVFVLLLIEPPLDPCEPPFFFYLFRGPPAELLLAALPLLPESLPSSEPSGALLLLPILGALRSSFWKK